MNKVVVSIMLILTSIAFSLAASAIEMEKTKSGAYIFPTVPYSVKNKIAYMKCPKDWILFGAEFNEDDTHYFMVSCLKQSEIDIKCVGAPASIHITKSGAAIPVGNISQCAAVGDIRNGRKGEVWLFHNDIDSDYRYELLAKTHMKNSEPDIYFSNKEILKKIKEEKAKKEQE